MEQHRPVIGDDLRDQRFGGRRGRDFSERAFSVMTNFIAKAARRPEKSRRAAGLGRRSEEAELLRAVADQEVLGLLVVIEHHLVGLAADARLLVAAERRMRRIGMVAVGPDAAGLDARPKR